MNREPCLGIVPEVGQRTVCYSIAGNTNPGGGLPCNAQQKLYKARAAEVKAWRLIVAPLTELKANRVEVLGDPQEKNYLMSPAYSTGSLPKGPARCCRRAVVHWILPCAFILVSRRGSFVAVT